jgi:hypothetical protein
LAGNREAVAFVVQAIEAANLRPASDMAIALDIAASHFYHDGHYTLASEAGLKLTSVQMVQRLSDWVDEFPIISIEDGLAENDWDGWRLLTEKLGHQVQLVGDDLFATNVTRVKRGIELGIANSVLIKVNQIGTLTETLHTIHAARAAGYSLVVSARSGETEDTTIADLAVGVAAEQIKIGSIVRSERLAKYNQLLRIQEQIAEGAGPRSGRPTIRVGISAGGRIGRRGLADAGRPEQGAGGCRCRSDSHLPGAKTFDVAKRSAGGMLRSAGWCVGRQKASANRSGVLDVWAASGPAVRGRAVLRHGTGPLHAAAPKRSG